MNASEIAQTLLNGNIAQARYEILNARQGVGSLSYQRVAMALDVVAELACLLSADPNPMDALLAHERSLDRVRRCLEGSAT